MHAGLAEDLPWLSVTEVAVPADLERIAARCVAFAPILTHEMTLRA